MSANTRHIGIAEPKLVPTPPPRLFAPNFYTPSPNLWLGPLLPQSYSSLPRQAPNTTCRRPSPRSMLGTAGHDENQATTIWTLFHVLTLPLCRCRLPNPQHHLHPTNRNGGTPLLSLQCCVSLVCNRSSLQDLAVESTVFCHSRADLSLKCGGNHVQSR
jgi:hypothetical protein